MGLQPHELGLENQGALAPGIRSSIQFNHFSATCRDRRYGKPALQLDGGQGGCENLFGLGADAEVGVGLGEEDAAVAGEDVGGG